MQDKCTKPCVGCQCHKGKDPKVKKKTSRTRRFREKI